MSAAKVTPRAIASPMPRPRGDPAMVEVMVDRLVGMSRQELQVEWRQQFHFDPPPRLSQDMLRRAIGYRIQEAAVGGLSLATQKALRGLAVSMASETPDVTKARHRVPALRPGVRLVRDWGGRSHTVLVLDDGFDYQGQRYRSLTEIARLITGAHWSGPRFFGLAMRRLEGEPSLRPRRDRHAAGDSRHAKA